jgi:hypothetical protein
MSTALTPAQEQAIRQSGKAAQRRRNITQNPPTYTNASSGEASAGASQEEVDGAIKSGEAAQRKRNVATRPVTQNPPDNAPNSNELGG